MKKYMIIALAALTLSQRTQSMQAPGGPEQKEGEWYRGSIMPASTPTGESRLAQIPLEAEQAIIGVESHLDLNHTKTVITPLKKYLIDHYPKYSIPYSDGCIELARLTKNQFILMHAITRVDFHANNLNIQRYNYAGELKASGFDHVDNLRAKFMAISRELSLKLSQSSQTTLYKINTLSPCSDNQQEWRQRRRELLVSAYLDSEQQQHQDADTHKAESTDKS